MKSFSAAPSARSVSKKVTMAQEPVPKAQPDKFRDLARKLECDEDEAKFEDQVKRIATVPRAPKNEKSPGD